MFLLRRLFFGIRNKVVRRSLTHDFRMLYFSRITVNSATQLMGLFLPIFLYSFFDMRLSLVVIYYLALDFLYAIFVPYGCLKIMNRIGIKRSLKISVLFGAAYYAFFFLLDQYFIKHDLVSEALKFWWLLPAMAFSLFFRLTHWIPYHTNLAKLTERKIRARQLSLMEATIMTLGAIMPVVAGLALSYLGYGALFLLALSIYLISIIPFSQLPKVEEKFTWTYKKTWQTLLSKKFRNSVFAYVGDGAESIVGAIIWPIFLWQLLEGNYLQVGIISSLIILATIILQALIGGPLDKLSNRRQWLRYGVFFYALGWVLKALISTAFQVFLFSAYHNISRIFSRTSFDALNYDIAADQGHFVDEYTVVREIAVVLGKAIMGVFVLLLIPFLPLRLIFILAALASLSMSLLKQGEVLSK